MCWCDCEAIVGARSSFIGNSHMCIMVDRSTLELPEAKVYLKKRVSMIRKYHNHKLQTAPWHREEEPLNHHETPGRQMKQSNRLSLPHQDDCNTRKDIK